MTQQRFEERFQVSTEPVVRLENVNGSIMVRPGADGEVFVAAVIENPDSYTHVQIEQKPDGSIFAGTRYSAAGWLHPGPRAVDYTVTVPAAVTLAVNGVNCRIDLAGLQGPITVRTVNGAVQISETAGELDLKSVNGTITGTKVSGPLTADTVNGRVNLADSHLPSAEVKTVNGNVELNTPTGAGPYSFSTVNGNVRLNLADAPAGRVHFNSVSGRARLNQERMSGGRKFTHTIAEGGPDLHFKSVSGNLDLASDKPVERPRAEMSEILERIARGEMTVDAGLQALKG